MNKDIDYYLNLNWTYLFEWSDADNGYIASVLELKGCKSFGETIEEATEMIKDALHSYIHSCLVHDDPIPEPLRPVDFKGKFIVRLTPEIHYQLDKHAKLSGRSLNKVVLDAVSYYLNDRCYS